MSVEKSIFSWDVSQYTPKKPVNRESPVPFGQLLGKIVSLYTDTFEQTYYGVVLAECIFFDDPIPNAYAFWSGSVEDAITNFESLTPEFTREEMDREGGGDHIFGLNLSEAEQIQIVDSTKRELPEGVLLFWPPGAYDCKLLG